MDTTAAARVTSCEVLERFLASYWTPRTRDNYRFILARWLNWCHEHGYDPVGGVDAAALETFIAELKTSGYASNTIVGRVSAVSAFYRWCVRERLVNRNPVEMIRRPSRPTESATASLTRHQLTGWLAAAERLGGAWWAAAMLLGLNGLRRGELVALAPPTMQAVAVAIDGRDRGPLLINQAGRRMTAYNVQYLVGALARDAAIPVHLTPHGLRHSAITIGLDVSADGEWAFIVESAVDRLQRQTAARSYAGTGDSVILFPPTRREVVWICSTVPHLPTMARATSKSASSSGAAS